jgi:TonB family protein
VESLVYVCIRGPWKVNSRRSPLNYKTNVLAILSVLLLVTGGYAQQNQTNPSPDVPKVVSDNAQPPKAVHREPPIYPADAKAKRIMGDVVVEAVVDRQGNVSSARMISGVKLFEDAALTAIKAWRFSPATLDGQPVEQTIQVQIKFRDGSPPTSAAAK